MNENQLIKFINHLRNQSFKCWNKDSINGYLTALITIEEKIKERKQAVCEADNLESIN